jgi:flagellar M-ring protein FliF
MKKLLASLSLRQKVTIVIAMVAAGASLYALINWRQEADFKPLFAGLPAEDAAAIVQKLKESGTPYRVSEQGGTILAPSARVAELRITMAGAGLPKSGRAGFELFDKTSLGTTEFAEHINYQRALEGELERSVMSLAEVEQARVHLTFPKDSVFLDQRQPGKASVLVRVRPGAQLNPPQILAIDHLIASAVEGLAPDAVSVLDMNGNLLGRPRTPASADEAAPSQAALEYKHNVESDILGKVNSTLEPLLGPGRFRAGVSAECDFTAGEQSEEIFDPSKSVMTSSQRTEDNMGGTTSTGVPGTASNLPRSTSRPPAGSTRNSRMTENVTYQSSRTVRKTKMPAGSIRKLSISVLLDQTVTWEKESGSYRRVMVPPAPEKLKVIRDLVAGVTGFSADRGDQLVVETLPFETTLLTEPPPAAKDPKSSSPPAKAPFGIPLQNKPLLYGVGAVGGLIALGLLWLLLRRPKKPKAAVSGPPAALPAPEPSATPSTELTGPVADSSQQLEAQLQEREEMQKKVEAEALRAFKLSPPVAKATEVLAKHLKEKVKAQPEVSAHAIQTWIREEGN